tara:strand:+ start:154 stop:387 length:234 start_codon:yes stop_codon:yes gene_type:complete
VNVGDLVQYCSGSQLYFHFPTESWQNVIQGEKGIIIGVSVTFNGVMYQVKMLGQRKTTCWFYEDELLLISGAEKNER